MLHYLIYCYSFHLIFFNHHCNNLFAAVSNSTYPNALAAAAGTGALLLFAQLVALMHKLRGHASEPNLGRVQKLNRLANDVHYRLLFIVGHERHTTRKGCIEHHS
jgi:hypothetical protein